MLTTLLLLTPLAAVSPSADADAGAGAGTPRGLYVEARTAAVYAGACHYGAQFTTQGRAAAVGWHVEAGRHGGVDLAGTDVAVALRAEGNLDEPGTARRSVVYLDAAASEEARRAALDWLRTEHAALLGEVVAVRVVPVEVSRDAESDAYALTAGPEDGGGDGIAVVGNGLPERECCKMPYDRWYDPLVPVAEAVVGCSETFRLRESDLGSTHARTAENNAFFGRFGDEPADAGATTAG